MENGELNLVALAQHFSDEDEAREFIEKLRWPDGPVCPHCGSTIATKLQGNAHRAGLYKCNGCEGQFTATVNTINKWAQGSADTYALGVLAEQTSLEIPVVVLPFVNISLASRAPFRRSVDSLREEGVTVLPGPGAFEPRPPRTGGSFSDYPWHLALDQVEEVLRTTGEDTARES